MTIKLPHQDLIYPRLHQARLQYEFWKAYAELVELMKEPPPRRRWWQRLWRRGG